MYIAIGKKLSFHDICSHYFTEKEQYTYILSFCEHVARLYSRFIIDFNLSTIGILLQKFETSKES